LYNRAQKYGFTGYNIDFEPTVNGTAEDAKNYISFLSQVWKENRNKLLIFSSLERV
jgi:endo-beta-N-acetylglucosaminidase D